MRIRKCAVCGGLECEPGACQLYAPPGTVPNILSQYLIEATERAQRSLQDSLTRQLFAPSVFYQTMTGRIDGGRIHTVIE